MRKTIATMLFLFAICTVYFLCSCDTGEKVTPASIDVLKIGKADCIIINTGNKIVMIDTGEEENIDQIRDFMDEHNYNKVDTLILTHYDKDHIGGAKYIIEEYGVDTVIVQMTPDMFDRGPGEYSGIVYIFLDFLDC